MTETEVNTVATRALAARGNNWFLPRYPSDPSDAGSSFPVTDAEEQGALDLVFGPCSGAWLAACEDEAVEQVMTQFCRLLPKLGLVAINHDPNTADFHWAKVRCVLAGAGHALHPKFVALLTSLYPQCPLRGDEPFDDWQKAGKDAHRICGWPIGLALVEWRDICQVIPQVEKGTPVPQWISVVALFHVLKHLRISRIFGAVVTYRNTAARYDLDAGSNIIGANNNIRQNLVQSLAGPAAETPKVMHPCTAALNAWLRALSHADVLPRRTLSDLPGIVQWGPWSTVVPDPMNTHGFIQHGLRLAGVWVAQDGKVNPTSGDTIDVVGYDWSLNPQEYKDQRQKFEDSLPATYDDTLSPHQLLTWGFPNLDTANYGGPEVAACLFDAVMCASMMLNEVARLSIEKPFIICLPTEPSLDESTNQGKTKCAHTIARVMSPGIGYEGISDGDSAPNQRAIAAKIERFGTLCVDEWRQPRSKGHLLSHENLQLMMTGGSPVIGKAYENEVASLYLRHPITASCKALDAPPDIINRSLIIMLHNLTDEQLQRADALTEIESGRLSVRMRLAALAMCERMGLVDKLAKAKHDTTKRGWRFNTLRAIAKLIWYDRYGGDGAAKLDDAVACMQESFRNHARTAEATGLLGALEEGTHVKVRLHSLFGDITHNEMDSFIASCDARMHQDRHGYSPTAMLHARAELMGLGKAPLSRLLEHFSGDRRKVSDRTMAHALSREIRALLPKVGDEWMLPELLGMTGWRLTRVSDSHGAPRVKLHQEAPAALRAGASPGTTAPPGGL